MSKPLSTVEAALAVVNLLKSAGLILATVLIEWANARAKLAENRGAVAQTELEIMKQKETAHAETAGLDSRAVVDRFLGKGE